MGAYPFLIQGKAAINGKTVIRYASVQQIVRVNLGNLPYPPRHLFRQLAVAVTEKPPFTLTAKFHAPEAVRGQPASMTVTATREAGFGEEIALSVAPLPPNVAAVLKNIPKNQNEVKIQLNSKVNAPVGTFALRVSGRAKYQNREVVATSAPVLL